MAGYRKVLPDAVEHHVLLKELVAKGEHLHQLLRDAQHARRGHLFLKDNHLQQQKEKEGITRGA